jgi:hypothetical protein
MTEGQTYRRRDLHLIKKNNLLSDLHFEIDKGLSLEKECRTESEFDPQNVRNALFEKLQNFRH